MINEIHEKFLTGRGISIETAMSMGIYSGSLQSENDLLAAVADNGPVLCYPFYENGVVVNEKYRLPGKQFRQMSGGRQTFYNVDILKHPDIQNGKASVVIVEGENDLLAVKQAGYEFVVSVPAGATKPKIENGRQVPVPDGTADIDIEADRKFDFLRENLEDLLKARSVIVATDNDAPGRDIAEQIARRILRAQCSFIDYPEDVKDLNDVLMKYGEEKILDLIRSAKPFPISGVYKLEDLPPPPRLNYVETGFSCLSDKNGAGLFLTTSSLMVVTGRAGDGKTTWTQQLVSNLARLHGWKCAIASFEMMIRPYVTNALGAAYLDKAEREWTDTDSKKAYNFVNDNFVFISPEEDSIEDHDLDWLIQKAMEAVIRHDIRVVLIDPWNEISHRREKNDTTTDYTNRALMKLRFFAKKFRVLVIVVAHPTKSGAAKNSDMTLYDISDSAAFQNKADFGVVVVRKGGEESKSSATGICVRKIRHQPDGGLTGEKELAFDAWKRIFY